MNKLRTDWEDYEDYVIANCKMEMLVNQCRLLDK